MAARQHRCRSMLRYQLQPLALALALSLAVALPGAAAGNDVISLTKVDSVHGLDNVDAAQSTRQSRPGKNFDYGAYANDFNLQEEASIPEDIFDQHDGDIKDTDSQLHYAPAASEATAVDDDDNVDVDVDDDDDATDAADAGHAEDAIGSAWSDADASAPWHEDEDEKEKETDASEAADIILESQRPTTRNFTVQLDTKETFKRKKFSSQKPNTSQVLYKLGNKKDRQQPKKLVNEGAVKEEEEAKATEASTDNAKLERKRIRYTKLKEMHEQRNQQKEQQKPKQQDHGAGRTKWQIGEKGEKREREEQLVDSIEILNERKCNKPSGELAMEEQLDPEQDTFQIEKRNEKEPEMERVKDDDEKTFGDIEDNFAEDKVIDIDESSKNQEPPPEATAATKLTSTGSGEATMPPTVAMIGRKEKRGFFRMYRPDLMAKYFEKFDEPDNTPVNVEDEDLDAPVGKLHYFENGGQPQEQQHPSQKELPTRTENGTQQQQQQQQPESRYTDDQNAEEQQPEQEPQEPQEDRLVSLEMRSSETESEKESEMESALQPFQETVTVPATTITPISATPSSAFELFKALRRSHQKAGHKSHKKRYKDYLKRHHQSLRQPLAPLAPSPPPPSLSPRHAQKLLEEQERERERERAHSAPIFALGIRPRSLLSTDKPFYEGRVYYYDHPQGGMAMKQDLEEQQQTTEMERLIAHDNDNWYRRISPILRNGVKSGRGEQHPHHQQKHQHHQSHKGHHQHQYKQHHNQHHSHHHHHHTNHHNPDQKVGQLLQRSNNPYQRRAHQTPAASMADSPSSSVATPPLPPLPPPTQQLGHQITELEHLERYYAKWPHLARVQFQLYDEQREPQQQPLLYGDYGDDYESAAELEEAQEEQGEEANLPPYIKKYNRRNKQLLNLLEGTLPPPAAPPIPSNPISGSVWSVSVPPVTTAVRLDDEYLKQKRRHYHQQHRFKDLFAEQRVETTTMAAAPPVAGETAATLAKAAGNQLPDEDGYVDSDEEQQKPQQQTFWQREMANKAVAPVDPPSSTPPSPVTTPKPALFKLPSYPAIAGSFLGAPRSRSRSAQFVANVAGRGQSSSRPRYDTSNGAKGAGESGESSVAASPLNSFVYHRVVDAIGGNSVLSNSRKQSRLPFVAITDRRLETMVSKRLLAERHKDFEQNHFPMP
ncbi:protein PRRC2C [Drosophila guanche]|uniref:Uncharacterized protein n=1 Tax=Drosophila guanche TaxID=7266 RepID=A0A3B0JZJ9_DROGU|nr:protein PRRC2C [Drosophila guanche]SPP86493.1 Hypothetical predicted protein [Drosophila guanche]